MLFMSLSPNIRSVLLLFYLLLFLMLLFEVTYLFRIRKKRLQRAALAAPVLLAFFFFQQMSLEHEFAPHMWSLPLWPVLLSCLFLAGTTVYFLMLAIHYRRSELTPMSIKEAVDELPAGLCFYYPNGLCRLVNTRMDEIARGFTGDALRDGRTFWNAVGYGQGQALIMEGERVWSIHKHPIAAPEGMMYELSAFDVTDVYRLNLELEEKRRKADEVNRRLKALNGRIDEVTREREILNSKIRMHDSWSRALLLTRKSILNPEGEGQQEAVRILKRNIALMRSERYTGIAEGEEREDILHAAWALGIRVERTGELPRDEERYAILNQAITVCVSNIAQHTDGHTLWIRAEQMPDPGDETSYTKTQPSRGIPEDRRPRIAPDNETAPEDQAAPENEAGRENQADPENQAAPGLPAEDPDRIGYRISFTNDGTPPAEPVRETGGLANLRRRVEGYGGRMELKSLPRYELILELPGREHGASY